MLPWPFGHVFCVFQHQNIIDNLDFRHYSGHFAIIAEEIHHQTRYEGQISCPCDTRAYSKSPLSLTCRAVLHQCKKTAQIITNHSGRGWCALCYEGVEDEKHQIICCVLILSPAKWRHFQRRLVGGSSWMSGRAQRRWKMQRNHKVSLQQGFLKKLRILMLIRAVWIIHNGSLIKRMLLLLSVCKLSISRFLWIAFIVQTYLLNYFRGEFALCLIQEELAGHTEWSEFTMITSVFIGYIDHLEGFCSWLDVLTFGRRTPARTLDTVLQLLVLPHLYVTSTHCLSAQDLPLHRIIQKCLNQNNYSWIALSVSTYPVIRVLCTSLG